MAETQNMTNEDYEQTQHSLTCLASLCRDLPLVGFIDRIARAESLAPILDSSLFLQAGNALSDLKELALSLRPFQQEIQRQLEVSTTKNMKGHEDEKEQDGITGDQDLQTLAAQGGGL